MWVGSCDADLLDGCDDCAVGSRIMVQGSYGSWKTLKVMEFHNHFPGLEGHGI